MESKIFRTGKYRPATIAATGPTLRLGVKLKSPGWLRGKKSEL
jgi:hypothetical protein